MTQKTTASAIALGATAAAAAAAVVGYASFIIWNHHRQSCTKSFNSENDDIPQELKECKYKDELLLAVKLAKIAGENMFVHCNAKGTESGLNSEANLGISIKSNESDFATAIDIKNENLILSAISKNFPTHHIIGEETTGIDLPPPLSKDHKTWIIDPIDGTTNFASGLPLTCVSIGLCDKGRPVMGVAFAPMTNELYIAIHGMGSFRNGIRIHAIDTTTTTTTTTTDTVAVAPRTLSNSIICYEFGSMKSKESIDRLLDALKRLLMYGCRATRTTGCGVLDLCYVASGRFDVVYTGIDKEGWKPWDYCAAMVIAEEAGCVMESLRKNDDNNVQQKNEEEEEETHFDIYSDSMICGVNKVIVDDCRRVVLGWEGGI